MRRICSALAAICLIGAGIGCSDATGPNTNLGLRVWAQVTPSTVKISDTSAAFTIRVHVENPRLTTVTVKGGPPFVFAWDPANSQGIEESFRIGNETSALNAGPNTDYWGQAEYVFPALRAEYTEAVITLKQWKAGGWALVPGSYRVRGYFNGQEGVSASLTLLP